jgi:hypothetical protein
MDINDLRNAAVKGRGILFSGNRAKQIRKNFWFAKTPICINQLSLFELGLGARSYNKFLEFFKVVFCVDRVEVAIIPAGGR